MSAITNVWRQLVQRRLWPVAILLIAALAGVPLALAQEPAAPAPPAPIAAADGETALAVQPIVAQASASDRGKRRKVLGTSKNPFGLPKDEATGSATPASSSGSTKAQEPATTTTSGGAAPSSGASSPAGGSPSSPPSVAPSPAPVQRTYSMYELTVRFGDSESGGARQSVKRLEPLPSTEAPVLIYLGVLKDGKTAVFLVDKDVNAIGDGQCQPTPDQCETVRLRAGDTEFFDVVEEDGNVSAQYQLDLVKIHKSSTTSASRAKSSSRAGQRLVQARVAGGSPTGYRWDASAGTLERRPVRRLVATVASQTVALP